MAGFLIPIAMGALSAGRMGASLSRTGAWSLLLGKVLQVAKSRIVTGIGVGATGTSLAMQGDDNDEVEATALQMYGGDTQMENLVGISNSIKEFIGEGSWLWPTHRDGTPVEANYLILDLRQGRGWIAETYRSYKMVQAARRSGSRRSYGRFHSRGMHPGNGRYNR